MRKLRGAIALLLVAGACAGGGGPQGAPVRTVLIDYEHDEFNTILLGYFPRSVEAHPGDTILFRQTWTGEPHSVTLGTLVDKVVKPFVEGTTPPNEAQVPEGFELLPPMFNEQEAGVPFTVNQTGAQPCYLESGVPPNDGKPCPKVKQPLFNGRYAYYNSGYIHYQGSGRNKYSLPLAEDIAPADYFYYCNLHGPGMSGVIRVQPKDVALPSQGENDRQARSEITKLTSPLSKAFKEARSNNQIFAGYGSPEIQQAAISEFIPKTVRTKVGEKVTWLFIGPHTISFNVPKYFPIISVTDEGTVVFNQKAIRPAGGWPGPPESVPQPPPEDLQSGRLPEPTIVDAGRWDGKGFRSSGFIFSSANIGYSVTFTERGTYTYACLVHPPMVGKVVVT